jgi:hypothetical protein
MRGKYRPTHWWEVRRRDGRQMEPGTTVMCLAAEDLDAAKAEAVRRWGGSVEDYCGRYDGSSRTRC